MKTIPAVCPVCKEPLTLSRREVQTVIEAVKKVKQDRYFVSDDEVNKIVHDIHDQRCATSMSEATCPSA